jgi:hypothetical protein
MTTAPASDPTKTPYSRAAADTPAPGSTQRLGQRRLSARRRPGCEAAISGTEFKDFCCQYFGEEGSGVDRVGMNQLSLEPLCHRVFYSMKRPGSLHRTKRERKRTPKDTDFLGQRFRFRRQNACQIVATATKMLNSSLR